MLRGMILPFFDFYLELACLNANFAMTLIIFGLNKYDLLCLIIIFVKYLFLKGINFTKLINYCDFIIRSIWFIPYDKSLGLCC